VTADLNVVLKVLTTACPSVRGGTAADSIGDVTPSFVASPSSTDEAAALLRAAAEHGLSVVPRGGGSRLSWGTPPVSADVVVDMSSGFPESGVPGPGSAGSGSAGSESAGSGVIEHAAGDLVARVRAGARMGAVREILSAAGQEIALDVPDEATVGGVVASGLAGPRRLRYGTPRDLLIGVTFVRADGTVAHSGGKVVKNVAGYDLGKLLAGSQGTLGLITEAVFRLHPLPAARSFVTASYPSAAAAAPAVSAAAASQLVPSAVEVRRAKPGGPVGVGVLLEGSESGVAARAAAMAVLLRAAGSSRTARAAAGPAWWPGAPQARSGTLIQVSFWVSALESVLDSVDTVSRDLGIPAAVTGSAGAGVVYIRLGANTPAHLLARLVTTLRRTLQHERGGVLVLAAPGPVRTALSGHGGLAGTLPSARLMRAVKDRFDPGHRLSPGRIFPVSPVPTPSDTGASDAGTAEEGA
jgi:glycolate oxidase FAD binding subunit